MITGYGVQVPIKNPVIPLVKEIRGVDDPLVVENLLNIQDWVVLHMAHDADGKISYLLGRVI